MSSLAREVAEAPRNGWNYDWQVLNVTTARIVRSLKCLADEICRHLAPSSHKWMGNMILFQRVRVLLEIQKSVEDVEDVEDVDGKKGRGMACVTWKESSTHERAVYFSVDFANKMHLPRCRVSRTTVTLGGRSQSQWYVRSGRICFGRIFASCIEYTIRRIFFVPLLIDPIKYMTIRLQFVILLSISSSSTYTTGPNIHNNAEIWLPQSDSSSERQNTPPKLAVIEHLHCTHCLVITVCEFWCSLKRAIKTKRWFISKMVTHIQSLYRTLSFCFQSLHNSLEEYC